MPTALVVEDEVWVAGEIQECLEALGFAPVLVASNGQQALEHLGQKNATKIDLMTLDLKLPEGPQGGHVLIICSAHDPMKFIGDDKIYRKATATIRKPFTQEQLKSTVLGILPELTPDFYPTG